MLLTSQICCQHSKTIMGHRAKLYPILKMVLYFKAKDIVGDFTGMENYPEQKSLPQQIVPDMAFLRL